MRSPSRTTGVAARSRRGTFASTSRSESLREPSMPRGRIRSPGRGASTTSLSRPPASIVTESGAPAISAGSTCSAMMSPAGPRSAVPGMGSKEGATARGVSPARETTSLAYSVSARRPPERSRANDSSPRPSTIASMCADSSREASGNAPRIAERTVRRAIARSRVAIHSRSKTTRPSGVTSVKSRAWIAAIALSSASSSATRSMERARVARNAGLACSNTGTSSWRMRARMRVVSALDASSRQGVPCSVSQSRMSVRSQSSSGRTMRPRW